MRLGRYHAVLTTRGGVRAALAVPVGYLALGIQPLALVYLVHDATGSFAEAGAVAAAPLIGAGVTASIQGRLIDRHGPKRLVPVISCLHIGLLFLVAGLVEVEAPAYLVVLVSGLTGTCFPQLTATMRVLWTLMLPDADSRQAAHALVGVTYQLALVAGPGIAAALLAVTTPIWALALACLLLATGVVGLTTAPAVQSWSKSNSRSKSWWGALASSGIRTLLVASAILGFAEGVLVIALPAFGISRDSVGSAGLLLSTLAAGTMVGGFIYGGVRWPWPLLRQWVSAQLALGGVLVILAIVSNVHGMAGTLFIYGLLFGAISVIVVSLTEASAPTGRLTEAFTVSLTTTLVGNAAGRAVAGGLLQNVGYESVVTLAAVLLILGAVIVVIRKGTLVRRGDVDHDRSVA